MPTTYIPRAIEPLVLKAASQFPAVLLTGARQTGKTTLLQHLFGATHGFVTLDFPENEELAIQDPQLFLDRYPAPVIVDEIQRAPELLRYLKVNIDRQRNVPGQYLLTGSQAFPLMAGVSESLAGRVAILELMTMSVGEQSGAGSVWQLPPVPSVVQHKNHLPIDVRMLRGGFPELLIRPDMESSLWFESYIRTYLERDVRQLRQVGDLRDFRQLMVALAARAGQLLNMSELSRDLGLAVNTVKAWISALEASRQVHLLQPYYRNLTKRLVRTPKLYFLDVGILCHLLGLRDPDSVLAGAVGGPVFENLVFCELARAFRAVGREPDLTFFRTSDGTEVDFLIKSGTSLHPVEVKRAATPRREMARGIERLREMLPGEVQEGTVILLGDTPPFPLTRTCNAIGIDRL